MNAALALTMALVAPTSSPSPSPSLSPPPAPARMVRVPASTYRSPVEKAAPPVEVAAFLLDATPVTNGAFAAFVEAHPKWRRDRVGRLFAETAYLSTWSPSSHAPLSPTAPVTYVSWFAARAYCAAAGKRLPTTAEWEVAARLDSARETDAVLAWYAAKADPRALRDVGGAPPNARGLRDMHGLVWEWVDDFAAALVASDGRSQNDGDVARFCGGGAQNAADPADYAAFMRFALRGSLEGNHTIGSLGFRCAQDLP